jgi:phage terminase large subunit GpA-like protein
MISPYSLYHPSHEHPLLDSERRAFRIEDKPLTLEWAEKNIRLVSPGYVFPGPYRARPWQREIVNAWHYWNTVIEIGAVQIGKSVNADIAMYYAMTVLGINGMVAYSESDTVESVFNLRIKDMIKSNPCLKDNWTGRDDDLTTANLKLKNCLWKVASAQNRNDLATFSAALCIGSEVAKWKTMKTYNPVLMLKGRSGIFNQTGQTKLFLESSPFEIGDYLYKEVHKSGTLIVTPHYRCPHCGCWQEWSDVQIILHKTGTDEPDHKPERIRQDGEAAVWYQCIGCKEEITEAQRATIDGAVVWAAPGIDQEDFKQEAETINNDGFIPGRLEGGKRRGFDSIAYNFSRLVDVSFPFYKCLALFFETKNDPEAKRTYETETMARWPVRQGRRVDVSYLESKKVKGFFQYGDNHRIPEDVVALTFGGDSQKDGFYYSIYGWGYMMSCWLIRHDFIKCPMDANANHQSVYANFKNALYAEPLKWQDESIADWRAGLLDRGGHRLDDVDFICQHMQNVKPYVGAAKYDDKKPSIYKSEVGNFFLGQPQMLSDFTGTLLGSDQMYFPWDTTAEYFDQIWRQFFEKRINSKGEQEEVWVHGYAGDGKATESGTGPDHYRDCFNLAYAAAKLIKLDTLLFNDSYCKQAKQNKTKIIEIQDIPVKPKQIEEKSYRNDPSFRRQGGYFKRSYGRGTR